MERQKLGTFTKNPDELTVHILHRMPLVNPKNHGYKSPENHNIVFFHIDSVRQTSKTTIKNFASQIGLGNYELDSQSDEDGLTEIKDIKEIKIIRVCTLYN